MGEWREVTIGDVLAEFHDGPHATPPPADSGPVYLGIKNVSENGSLDLSSIRHIAEEDFDKWTKRVTPRRDDIVFSYEATLHRYALIPEGFRGCLGRRLALFRPRLDRVDPRYLHHALLGPEWRRTVEERVLSGATVDRIPIGDVPGFPLRLPQLVTQRHIAAVLSAFDELIEINERRIEVLEDLARSLYREWFVHFRFPGHQDVEMVDSALGPIPEGWGVPLLGEVITLRYGKALPAKRRRAGEIPVVSSAGVIDHHDEALVEGPGVVVGRKGNAGSVWWIEDRFFPIDTTYFVDTDLPLSYVFHALDSAEFIDSHAAVPGLSREQANHLPVLVPPGELLARFEAVVRGTTAMIAALGTVIDHLAATRDLLLPRLVTGRLDISDLDLGTLTPVEAG